MDDRDPSLRMTAARWAWGALPVHLVICGAVLFVDGFFLFGSVYDGLLTIVEVALFAAVTTIAALIVGLPLRAVPALRRRWIRHPGVTLVAVGVAAVVAVLAWFVGDAGPQHFPGYDGMPPSDAVVPDELTAVVGWFALAFTTAHAWLPTRPLRAVAATA